MQEKLGDPFVAELQGFFDVTTHGDMTAASYPRSRCRGFRATCLGTGETWCSAPAPRFSRVFRCDPLAIMCVLSSLPSNALICVWLSCAWSRRMAQDLVTLLADLSLEMDRGKGRLQRESSCFRPCACICNFTEVSLKIECMFNVHAPDHTGRMWWS